MCSLEDRWTLSISGPLVALSLFPAQWSFRQWQEWRSLLSRQRRRPKSYKYSLRDTAIAVLLIFSSPAYAALINFQNCLDPAILASNPPQLQFVPLDVSATFDLKNPLHALNITVYGNVTGTADGSSYYPSPDSSSWTNPNDTYGKIPDVSVSNNKYTTLVTTIGVLSFSPYSAPSAFCDALIQGTCPLAPVFDANATDLTTLRAFSVEHDMLSAYRFATISSTFLIKSGDAAATHLGCVSVSVTPGLGSALRNVLTFIPLLILLVAGISTVAAAIYSPWGSTDPFRWTSNYGRDEDVLRLVTPGFADCLQYLQFAVLTGALSLNYPGYYQPVVSQVAWSSLMFNQSFVSAKPGINPVVDGVYAVNGTYGLDQLGQLVGMDAANDIWPGMVVWLLVILGSITLLIQLAFAFRWVHREIAHIPEEDLRAKNMPFTVGNVIRIVFNYLLLPLVSISFFQLVIAHRSPAYSVALAVIVITITLLFSAWLIRVIATTRPKAVLFDDLPTVLVYGPLYNTFSDDAAAYAFVPMFMTFTRGVAIGALQPSGIAQLVLLAICEVVTVLTLVAFRPFPAPTSMNLYHCGFALVRFLAILLSVTFVPSLQLSEAVRGWIGYVVLALHAIVLVFGFFLNALQTLIEVIARLAGAGGYEGGATRGGLTKVFGMRQLSRRVPRRDVPTRQSIGSEAAMLAHMDDRMSAQLDGSRPRSFSGSSALLLNRATPSDGRASVTFESASARTHSRANSGGMYTPPTLAANPLSFSTSYYGGGSDSPKSATIIGMQPQDPYYRPPRPSRPWRRNTQSSRSTDTGRGAAGRFRAAGDRDDEISGLSLSGRGTPVPAYIPAPKEELEYDESQPPRTDYAVREVDFYYRVRGPPLSQSGNRKLKTGPADPTGPVSSATGWFRNIFRGKTKEKNKGFEVVRSARAPPPGLIRESYDEPYHDDPEEQAVAGHSNKPSESNTPYQDQESDVDDIKPSRPSDTLAPELPIIESVGNIELPSRMGSRSSARGSINAGPPPSVPRRSSKRQSASINSLEGDLLQQQSLAVVVEGQVTDPSADAAARTIQRSNSAAKRLPFAADTSMSSRSRSRNVSLASTTESISSARRVGSDATTAERPSSMGVVPSHRAGDSIHQPSSDEPAFTGNSAELVDEPSDSSD